MTAPDTTAAAAAGNTDAPTAVVGIGPTEIVGLLTTIAGILAALFGKDWGIAKNAEAIVSLGFLVGPMVIGFSRAIKHHGAAHANAAVYLAQLSAVGRALDGSGKPHTPAALAAGVATLNAVPDVAAVVTAEGDAAP